MRRITAVAAGALACTLLFTAAPSASANASPKATCTAVMGPSKTVEASALAQYLKPSSTKIQPTSFSIKTKSQGIGKNRTDFTLHVTLYTVGQGITQEHGVKKGTHTVNDLWGPTFSKLKTLPKGKNRVNINGWFDLSSKAAVQCPKAVSFAF
ncbi:hypothetical protein ACIP5L_15685 [Streptomyces bacillaris]|uniref:hypothetical protein n=1 Tax=Streptomyces bacillaris TaxID=68179 RepID=UPI00381F2542